VTLLTKILELNVESYFAYSVCVWQTLSGSMFEVLPT